MKKGYLLSLLTTGLSGFGIGALVTATHFSDINQQLARQLEVFSITGPETDPLKIENNSKNIRTLTGIVGNVYNFSGTTSIAQFKLYTTDDKGNSLPTSYNLPARAVQVIGSENHDLSKGDIITISLLPTDRNENSGYVVNSNQIIQHYDGTPEDFDRFHATLPKICVDFERGLN